MEFAPLSIRQRLLQLSAVCVASLWLAGCSHSGSASSSPTSPPASRAAGGGNAVSKKQSKRESSARAQEELRSEAYARFAAGMLHDLRDEEPQALEDFEKAVRADPTQDGLALDVARRYLIQKNNDRAIAVLQDAVKAGGSGVLSAFLASIYASLGRNQEAIAANQEAIKRSPTLLIGYQNLANLFVKQNQPEEGLKVLDQAGAIPNPTATFLVELAELWLSFPQAKPETTALVRKKAAALLDRMMALPGNSSMLLQRAADAYLLLGQNTKAIDLYLKLVDQYPQATPLRERLADLLLQSKDSKRAMEQMEALIKEEPSKYPQAYLILGSLAIQDSKYKEAEDYLRKAVVLAPKFEPAYYDLAIAQINAGNIRTGLETLEDARRRFSETFQTEFFSGIAYSRLKEYSNAVTRFTTAEIIARSKETNRLTHLFYFQLGSAHERNQNLEEAERYFRKSLELMPDFSEALNYLGYMWVEHGVKLEEAKRMIERAVELEPKNSAFLDSLAWVLFKLAKPKEALPWMKKAVEFSTEPDPTLYDHLGDIQSATGDVDGAKASWKKSIELESNPEVLKKLGSQPAQSPAKSSP